MTNDYSEQPYYDPRFKSVLQVIAAGTAYALTATAAAVTFGTTSPSLTIPTAGRYLVWVRAHWTLTGATFGAIESVTISMRKGTTAITGWSSAGIAPVLTTTSQDGMVVMLTPWPYTAAAGDVLNMYGLIAATPSAGSAQITEADITALPL